MPLVPRLAIISLVAGSTALSAAALPEAAFFKNNCYECHDTDVHKAGLDLTALKWEPQSADNQALWVKIHDRVRDGEMPPAKKKERPEPVAVTTLTGGLAKRLIAADVADQKAHGRTPLRRLSRVEFEWSVRDLLGMPALSLKDSLPEDGKSHAGHSRRMGSPKLLLSWRGTTVIEHLLATLNRLEIAAAIVVVRPNDLDLQAALARTTATVIVPDHDPPDMRDSVELGLAAIRERFQPTEADGWLLIPADHPVIEPEVLDGLLAQWFAANVEVLVPKFGERRGHPALFRWSLAARVEQLPRGVGINALWRESSSLITEWPTDRESVLIDLDTPEDYERWSLRE